jgi:hypothetical protein
MKAEIERRPFINPRGTVELGRTAKVLSFVQRCDAILLMKLISTTAREKNRTSFSGTLTNSPKGLDWVGQHYEACNVVNSKYYKSPPKFTVTERKQFKICPHLNFTPSDRQKRGQLVKSVDPKSHDLPTYLIPPRNTNGKACSLITTHHQNLTKTYNLIK